MHSIERLHAHNPGLIAQTCLLNWDNYCGCNELEFNATHATDRKTLFNRSAIRATDGVCQNEIGITMTLTASTNEDY